MTRPLRWLDGMSPLLVTTCAMMTCATAFPADVPTADIREIADGVYVRAGHVAPLFQGSRIANLGFVVGENCVAVIDSGGSVSEGRELDAAISRLTDVRVCYVINTHVHPDHVFGNEVFERRDVQFIGHENLPGAIGARGDTYRRRSAEQGHGLMAASRLVPPERTVAGTLQLNLGGRVLMLRAHPTAHTDNDLTVLDVRTDTLFVGDLVFLEHLPVLDGSINGWLDDLERLAQEKHARVVPGHGPPSVAWPDAAAGTRRYLADLRDATRGWIAKGGDLYEAQEEIGVAHPGSWQLIGQYHKSNVAAAFAELEWEE